MEITTESSIEELLNAYIADEFFASMQYKMAKVVAKGKALEHSTNVFGDNGDEEDEHFDEIVEYAQSLGIKVQVNLDEMKTNCTTPFVEVYDGDTTAQLVAILISAEKKAISGYETGLRNEKAINEHPELTQFFGELLNDERGHLKELEDLKSTIGANGKVVPQSDNEEILDKKEKESNEITVTTDDGEEKLNGKKSVDDSDTEETSNDSGKNESLERTYSNEILRKITLGESDGIEIAKNLICYINESMASDFVDYCGIFSSNLARETSMYNESQCKHKLCEMIDDGLLNEVDILKSLMTFIGESDVKEFASSLGIINESVQPTENIDNISVSDMGLSFFDIFKKASI